MQYKKVGIIGLGLIGGSIAKRLKANGCEVYTVKSKSLDVERAKKWVKKVFSALDELVQEIDLLVIATPLSQIIPIAKKIKATRPLLIVDVGSVKEQIVKEFCKLTRKNVEFFSTHPMAGSEKKGFEASDADLFEKAPWIVTPHRKNRTSLDAWIRSLGAKPISMSAKEHDEKMALISHLPTLISILLLKFAKIQDPKSLRIAGPGFKSMTRLALGNQELIKDFFKSNAKNIQILQRKWLKFIRDQSILDFV